MTAPPLLRVMRGDPTAEELAALIAVVGARAATAEAEPAPPSPWNRPATLLRRPLHPGPGGWKAGALPR